MSQHFPPISATNKHLVTNLFLFNVLTDDGVICFVNDKKTEAEIVTYKFCDSVVMNKKSFSGLRKSTYLNDEVINFYGRLLKQADKSNQYFYFSTHFYATLRYCGKLVMESTRVFFTNVNVFEKNKIFIPVHIIPNHWALVVVDFVSHSISYYDSMYFPMAGKKILNDILQWLIFASSICGVAFDKKYWSTFEGAPGIPQQNNGFDCGVFVILFMDFISRNRSVSWIDSSQTTDYRFTIGYAIIAGDLDLIHHKGSFFV
jgi:sentrin-specific protease 1